MALCQELLNKHAEWVNTRPEPFSTDYAGAKVEFDPMEPDSKPVQISSVSDSLRVRQLSFSIKEAVFIRNSLNELLGDE